MDKAKQQLLEQTHKIILEEGLKSKNPERLLKITGPNIVGLGTTYDEKIIGLEDLRILLKRQQEQGKNLSFSYDVTNLGTHISKDENTAVSTNEIDLSITTDGETISMLLRFSVVLEYLQNKWVLVHFHSSKPEEVESEKDTWGIETWKEKAEELEKEVAERTADLILKNRDLAIEAALERVRARSMAMHSSDELNEVVAVLFENLKELQIPITAAGIQVYLEDSEDMLNYVCGENSEGLVISHYRMPYFDNAIINDFKNARQHGGGFFVGNYSKKIKDSFYTYLFENTEIKDVPEDIKQMIFDSRAYTISMAPVSNSLIAINDFQGNQLSENNVAIIKRFAKVFEQAYIRFRDLQKAEAQNKESQIQLALERVRAKTMAMQHSDELREVVLEMYEQLQQLDFDSQACNIIIIDQKTHDQNYWVSGFSQELYPESYHVPNLKHPYIQQQIKAWKKGKTYEVFKYEGIEKKKFDKIFFSKTDFKKSPKEAQEMMRSLESITLSTAFTKYGSLQVLGPAPLNESKASILLRFAKVFNQTYTRFLDLKKAEAQAREAQIEAALEKVRSRSMAMHNSQELKEVALELRKQMGWLGQKDLEVCAIHLYGNDEDSFESWSAMKATGSETEIVQTQAHFPKRGIRIVDEMVHHYTIGTKDYILVNEGEKIAEWFKVLKKHAPELHSSILDSIGKVPVKQQKANWAVADFSGGALVMVTYGEPDEVSRNLLRRSANVFEQAYVRFLDLQKAEAQAREAQIQLCLERVRAKSMAMQSSNELETIIQVVHDQFVDLGITLDHAGFIIDYKTNNDMIIWLADEHKVTPQIRLSYFDSPHWNSFITAKEKGHKLFVNHLDFKTKNKFYKQIFKYVPELPEDAQSFYLKIPSLTIATSLIDTIGLYIENFSGVQYGEEDQKILLRFGEEFQQAYTRFLDLKKVEAQARESQIQLSLERVRARSMAMQSSDELHDVIGIVFQQFDNLGIHPVNVFLSLFHREERTLTYRASGKSGTRTPTKQNVDIDSVEAWTDLYNKWINDSSDEVEVIYYPKEIVPDILNLLKDTFLAMPKKDRMTTKDFPEGGYSTLGYTPFGYIGYDHTRPPTEEEKSILKRICTEFGRVYQRFLDIEKAEAQAREAQIENALEKVRGQSMAMHNSDQLKDVVREIFDQMGLININAEHAGIVVDYEPKKDWHFWVAETQDIPAKISVPYLDSDWDRKFTEAKKNGDLLFTILLNFEEKNAFYEELLPYIDDLTQEMKDGYFKRAGLAISTAIQKDIGLYIENFSGTPYTEEENLILLRFAKVFQQTYTRFLDLKKAEAQTREAQIEAALEKVRSRSMGMQKSTELLEVISVVSQQLQTLGFRFSHVSFINNSLKEHNSFWVAATGLPNPMRFIIPYKAMPIIDNLRKAQKNKDAFYTDVSTIKEHQQWFQHLLNHSGKNEFPKEIIDYQMSKGLARSVSIHTNIMLALANTQSIPYSDYENKIIARFGQVFEQSYTRFLDLQRAESQAREAQIEMSLEKVRSRTMAMQTSSELPEAANTLFLEVQALGIPAWSAGYCIWQDDKHNAKCNMSSEGEIQKGFVLPSIGEGYDFYTPQENGERFYVKELGGEALVKHYEFMKQLPNVGEIFNELIDAGLELPTFQIFHIVYFKFGYVMFITYQEVPEAHDIFKRFGQVFEQTYTRFLDLERAEAQAREARIEMALEKVRSRTMAMQHSNELREASQLLFNEVRALGIPSWSCGYNILSDDKKSAECWMSSEGTLQKPFTLVYEKEVSFIEMYDFFKGDDTFLIQELSGTALQSHYDYLKSFPNLVPIFNDLQKAEISLPTYQINHLCKFNKGYLLFITYEPVPEAHELFVRFTKVFEQTYTRFLDLKQAEARAREAQIQSALERVRSHSMGMQSTTDFANVTTEMFNQLRNFGEDLFATGIVFCDKHEGHVEQWHSIPGAGMLSPMIVPIDLDYIHQYRYDQWKVGTTLFSIEIPSDFIEQHFEAIFKLPSAQVTLKDLESRNAPMPAPPAWEIDYGASFKHGYILASSLKPIENMDILPRFAQVFEQAYIRFLDLQKAEAQARESQIEAALEKVRSRTLAMQKSDELADTSVVVFKELLELGIEPNRLFIGIVKDNGDAIEAWATNEDGSKIEQHFKLYTSKNKSIKKMVEGWKQQKKSAIIDMQGKELQEYFHYLNKVMHIPFIDGLKQKRRVQSIAYFSGGLIGMAAPEEQPEETINLLERFAAVFNLTYTRFNDLKIAEAQAEQAEQDLINLQKAKKNAEKALAELQNTQKQLVQSEKMASLGELTAGIAHEIQNPLNFVNNFSEVSKELLDEMLEEIENGDMDEVRAIMNDVITNLEKINHHGKRADGIVKGMLQHSRASGDKKEATDINALADEYLRLAYHGLRAKDKSFNAQLVTDFDESIGKVDIIPQDIGRVVLNLLTNAFYAVNEKQKTGLENYEPAVAVRTKKIKDSIEIEVTDNGNGMPQHVVDKIFQPFYTTKPTGQGTGLGLSMSYDIITKGHGGELKVETKEGKGTIFILELPL